MARAAKVQGDVVVEVVVDETGHVAMAHAVSGHPLLRDSSVRAARDWVFTPAEFDGKPVKIIGTITFHFRADH
jgi:TonB family protein